MLWRYHPKIGGAPGYYEGAVVDSVIFAGSPFGALTALDVRRGSSLWADQIFADSPETMVIDPTADSDVVVDPYKTFSRPPTGGVVALDAQTGAVRWVTPFPRPGGDTLSGGRSAILWRSQVIASCESGRIYGIDRKTGEIRWSLPDVGGHTPAKPAAPNGGPIGRSDVRQLAAAGATLYVASSSEWFHAYDLETRNLLWKMTAAHGSSNGHRISVDQKAVYVIQAGGQLVAFSTAGPSILWESGHGLGGGYFSRPVIAPDRLFLGGKGGVYAIER